MATQQPLKQSGSPDVPHRMDLLDRPGLNKGTAFTEEERSKFGLHGLLLHVGVADAALKSAPVDVTLIDRRIYHLFQPLLYQVATGSLSPGEIAAPLRSVLSRHKNTRVLLGEVVDLDPLSKRVLLADGASFEYDSLIVSAGSQTFHYGYDAWRESAPGMKSIEEATNIRHKILYAFAAQRRVSHRQGRSGRSRTPLGRYCQEPHAVRQPLLLGRLFPRQRDRTRPRLSRLRNGRPVVRGEFDVRMRVAAHRSHNLTDAIESLPSGLHRPKHKSITSFFSDAA
jgi:Pyridine nucleotide-disulphide oxidoreductase